MPCDPYVHDSLVIVHSSGKIYKLLFNLNTLHFPPRVRAATAASKAMGKCLRGKDLEMLVSQPFIA